jgi:7-keto-8-aminopelargonate synthetase-like enzyme
MARRLLEEGVFINPIVSPAVPKEDCIIRFSLMATHTYEQVDRAIGKITSVAKELDLLACEVELNKIQY